MPNRLKEMYSHKEHSDSLKTKSINISELQKLEAELLQKQLFYTFEKVEEKS